MASYFIVEYSLANGSALAYKIGCLSNPIKNSLLTYLILLSVLGPRLRALALAMPALAGLCLLGHHSIILALTNALFTIHPPLLYVFTMLSVSALAFSKRRLLAIYAAFWALSIAMGGFWSMQELSWGGWWNWDVIECGIAYQFFLGSYLAHRSYKSLGASLASSIGVGLSALVYTALNKLGVGVSIHSFVTSASVQAHYGAIASAVVLTVLAVVSRGLIAPAFYVTFLLFFYCGTRSFNIVKPAATWVAVFYPSILSRRPALFTYHKLIWYIVITTLVFNYTNSSFFYSHNLHKVAASVSRSGKFWALDLSSPNRQKLIWDGLWLSKPRYSCFWAFESWSTRSSALRSSYSSFLK